MSKVLILDFDMHKCATCDMNVKVWIPTHASSRSVLTHMPFFNKYRLSQFLTWVWIESILIWKSIPTLVLIYELLMGQIQRDSVPIIPRIRSLLYRNFWFYDLFNITTLPNPFNCPIFIKVLFQKKNYISSNIEFQQPKNATHFTSISPVYKIYGIFKIHSSTRCMQTSPH